MPRISLGELLKRLSGPGPTAVVFLHGEEEYLRDRAMQQVVSQVVDPATRDFNLDQIRGSDASPELIASLAATPPMMADRRVVLIRDAQGLTPKSREVVEGVLASPDPAVVLVLTATIPSGSKAKFYEALKSKALSVEFPAVDAADLPGWIVEHAAAEHGVEVDLDAARALAGAIGAQLGILVAELEKAVSYVGDRSRVTLSDIEAVGGYVPRVDRWAWFDTVGERKFALALRDLPELLAAGESGVGLVIGLGGHLLKLGLFAAGGREGLDRFLGSNQRWLVNRLQPQARGWSVEAIDRAMADLLRTDRLLKSASMTDRQAIEELLLRLAAPDDRFPPSAPVDRAALLASR